MELEAFDDGTCFIAVDVYMVIKGLVLGMGA